MESHVGPRNSYLCIYCHGNEGGISAQDPETEMPRFVSWKALARALPLGVRYLWLVGCSTSECLKVWSKDDSPVRHRLLATNEDRYFGRLVRLFAKEIDVADIGFDDEMMARLKKPTRNWRSTSSISIFPDDQCARVIRVPQTQDPEPSPVAACDDPADFASHRDFLLARKRETHIPHTPDRIGRYHQLIQEKVANRPSV